jgi:hypothetical protein
MIQPDVPVVLLAPGLVITPSLTTFATDAVESRCFQVKVILDGPIETGDLPRQKADSFCYVSIAFSHYG